MMLLVLLALTQTPTTTTVSAHGHGFHGFVVGDTIKFEAHVFSSTGGWRHPRPTGTVTFDITDSNLVTTTLGPVNLSHWGSKAEAFTSTLTVGTYLVVATYSGDANFATSSNSAAPFSITISPATTHTQLSPHFTFALPNTTVTFTANVSTGWGFSWRGQSTPVPVGGSVNFSVDGVLQAPPVATDASGNATFTYTTPATTGVHTISASYQGTTDYGASTSHTSTVNVVTTLPTHSGFFWFHH